MRTFCSIEIRQKIMFFLETWYFAKSRFCFLFKVALFFIHASLFVNLCNHAVACKTRIQLKIFPSNFETRSRNYNREKNSPRKIYPAGSGSICINTTKTVYYDLEQMKGNSWKLSVYKNTVKRVRICTCIYLHIPIGHKELPTVTKAN